MQQTPAASGALQRPVRGLSPFRRAGLLLASAALSSCAAPAGPSRQPITLHIGVASPAKAQTTVGLSSIVGNLAFEPLVSIGWDGRPTAKLARAWTWSEDRKTVRFDLDPSVTFHDGTPLTSSLARDALTPRLSDSRVQQISISYNSVKSIETDGEHTLVVRLSRPEAFFLSDLTNSSLNLPADPDIGTGPYKWSEAGSEGDNQSDRIRLLAFDAYHRGRPATDAIELRRYDEHRSAWAALMRGEIDAVHETSPGAMDFIERQKTVRTFPLTRPYYMNVLFSMRHPDLRKAAVRQALSHAVDREALIRLALDHRGIVADSPIWPQHWAYDAAPRKYGYNREAARLLLDGAGYAARGPAAPGRPPSRFRFVCLTIENDARFEKLALLLQKQFFEIGVDMEVQALPLRALGERIQTGDFDALLAERSSGRSLTWTYTMFHSSTTPGGYTATDEVLDRLRGARTDEETRTAVCDLLRILYDDPPAIFLAWPVVARAVSETFVVPAESGRDVMGSVWQWKPAAPRRSP